MLSNLSGWHIVLILAIVLLLFGAPKLPGLARSLGQSMKILRKEMKPADEADAAETDGEAKNEANTTTSDVKSTPKS